MSVSSVPSLAMRRLGAIDLVDGAGQVFFGRDVRELALVRLLARALERRADLGQAGAQRGVLGLHARVLGLEPRHARRAARCISRFCSIMPLATSSPLPPLTTPSGRATVPSSATAVTPRDARDRDRVGRVRHVHRVADQRAQRLVALGEREPIREATEHALVRTAASARAPLRRSAPRPITSRDRARTSAARPAARARPRCR